MRLKTGFISLGLCLLSCLCIYLAAPADDRGLEVGNPVHDFGAIDQGRTVEATFRLTNHAAESILVRDVVKECGCSSVAVSKDVVAPGETVDVRVGWDTTERKGESRTGVRVLFAKQSDPAGTREVSLQVAANVRPGYECRPERLSFDGTGREVVTARVEIIPGIEPDVKLTSVSANHPALAVEKISDHEVKVSIDPTRWGAVNSRYDTCLVLETTSTKEPRRILSIDCGPAAEGKN